MACGLVAAVALTRFMTFLLFGISPLDPATYGGVCLGPGCRRGLRQLRAGAPGDERRPDDRVESRMTLPFVETTMRDVRYALRILRKAPGFAIAATLILAVTIGANAAVYSLVDRLLVRPLPYPQSDRLATIIRHTERGGRSDTGYNTNGATWLAMRDGVRDLDIAVVGGGFSGVNLTGGDETAFVQQQRVSAGFFRVLGVTPAIGREFTTDEDLPGGAVCRRAQSCDLVARTRRRPGHRRPGDHAAR